MVRSILNRLYATGWEEAAKEGRAASPLPSVSPEQRAWAQAQRTKPSIVAATLKLIGDNPEAILDDWSQRSERDRVSREIRLIKDSLRQIRIYLGAP